MFKKPLSNLKTSAPLRGSDRRKLKQQVITSFTLLPDDGDLLVPDGLLSVKFGTHIEEPGVAYLAPDGEPLWFTLGKGSDDLIPTVYTLWKRPNLLPVLSTPPAVIPILVGGADLMIPGVIHHTPALRENQLVSISQYTHNDQKLSSPLVVGRMAIDGDRLREGGGKGKAVYVIHTWKDHLWEMGGKREVPEPVAMQDRGGDAVEKEAGEAGAEEYDNATPPPPSETPSTSASDPTLDSPEPQPQQNTNQIYTPQEISSLLLTSLIHAISATLSHLPPSQFPIPSTTLYTSHILPSRPAFPLTVLPPSSASTSSDTSKPDTTAIDIKHSTHKSLSSFLKFAEKSDLITLKSPPKKSAQTDLLITAVNRSNPSVLAHRSYPTLRDVEVKAAKKVEREEKEKEEGYKRGGVEVKELWKPHQGSAELFEAMRGNPTALYTLPEIKSLLNAYITTHSLVNPREQAYINIDAPLLSCISSNSKGKSKGKGNAVEQEAWAGAVEFVKRDELTAKVVEKMQSWHEVRVEGGDPVLKKGALKPVRITIKVRQGRKASTLVTGFEPFLVVGAEEMVEELRRVCASATSVSPIPGKPANSGLEVLVQGKQTKAVVDLLVGRGIPKKWIEVVDLAGKK